MTRSDVARVRRGQRGRGQPRRQRATPRPCRRPTAWVLGAIRAPGLPPQPDPPAPCPSAPPRPWAWWWVTPPIPFYAEYTRELQQAAADAGFALLMTYQRSRPRRPLRAMLDLYDRQIDGLIVTRATADDRGSRYGAADTASPWSSSTRPRPSATPPSDRTPHTPGWRWRWGTSWAHRHQCVASVIGECVKPDIAVASRGLDAGRPRGQPTPTGWHRPRSPRRRLPRRARTPAGSEDRPAVVTALRHVGPSTCGRQRTRPASTGGSSRSELRRHRGDPLLRASPLTTVRLPVVTMAVAAIDLMVQPPRRGPRDLPDGAHPSRSCEVPTDEPPAEASSEHRSSTPPRPSHPDDRPDRGTRAAASRGTGRKQR